MKKYIVIILLFNISFSTMNEDELSNRFRFDFELRQQSNLALNTYRNEDELLQLIESIIQTHLIPGLSIAIVKDEHIVWEKYLGYANIDENILIDSETKFILSSVSKTITATALMQLFEENLFMLDDDIDDYLPFNVNHPDYNNFPITFKMLLSHTSGIKDNWSVMPYYNGDSELELGYYLQEYLMPGGEYYSSNSNFTNSIPGTNYSYSNIGAALIGFLVEQISNQSFNEYCNENIFEPLEMDNSFWLLSEIEDLNQVAIPYQFVGGTGNTCYEIGCGVYNESNSCHCDYGCINYNDCCIDYDEVCSENGTGGSEDNLLEYMHYGYSDYPSGQLRSTSNNIAKFMIAYLNDGMYNDIRILNSETIELIKTIQYPNINQNQGLIWYYKNQNERSLFGHNGGDIGSLTEMFISFSDSIGVVLLSNTSNYNALIQIENALFEFANENSFSIIGDINQDTIIDILDIILIVNIIFVNEYNYLADLNNDLIINILDIIFIVDIILNS